MHEISEPPESDRPPPRRDHRRRWDADQVHNLEVFDGTPILDVKSLLVRSMISADRMPSSRVYTHPPRARCSSSRRLHRPPRPEPSAHP
jgi:hypothetical protein